MVRKPDDTTGTVEKFSKKNRNIGKVRTEICVVEENSKAGTLFRFCNKLRYKQINKQTVTLARNNICSLRMIE